MKVILKQSALLLFIISLSACNMGVQGDGNVQVINRSVTADFTTIKASNGLRIELHQSNTPKIIVEADENLQALIKTDIKDDMLRIYTTENIGQSTAKKVSVYLPKLKMLQASSGCDIQNKGTFNEKLFTLDASSGANVNFHIESYDLKTSASSGASVTLQGKTKLLDTKASSGANIDAYQLKAQTVTSQASSGASIDVLAQEAIKAKASSGANISYKGNPNTKTLKASSGASVSKE